MRIITQIIQISKNRSKILLDDHTSFVLYKSELRFLNLKVDSELSDELYQEIIEKILAKRAKLRSLALLKDRSYTEKQLIEKLKRGLYPEIAIKKAVEYVKSYHYIDDYTYAKDYIEYHSKSMSVCCIENNLLKKGIDKSLICEVFSNWSEEGGNIDELDQILRLIHKKRYDVQNSDLKEKQKIIRYLLYKGYKINQILKVIQCEEYSSN